MRTEDRKKYALEIVLPALAVLMLMCATPRAQVQITVPAGHWSLETLEYFAQEGLAPGYRPEDFRGIDEFTRQEVAAVAAAVIAHYKTNRRLFSLEDAQLLGRLRDEYEPELARFGETSGPDTAALAAPAIVPAGHWAYPALAGFAARGLLEGHTESDFMGGRIFTRMEMARAALPLIDLRNRNPDAFSGEDMKKTAYLESEFAPELERLEAAGELRDAREPAAAPAGPAAFDAWGSSNIYASIKKGEKTDISNRLTYETRGSFFKTYFTGSLDNSHRSGAAVDFGGGYTFEPSRKLIEFHSAMDTPARDAFLLLGDVTNITWADGLTVGSAGIKGAYLSSPAGDSLRAVAAWGDDDGGEELMMCRLEETAGRNRWGVSYVKGTDSGGQETEAAGVDVSMKTVWGGVRGEFSDMIDGGDGFFIGARRSGVDDVTMDFEYRKYRDFTLAHNNAPEYSGRSGSSGENEKSIYGRIEWRNGSRWTHAVSRDHIYSPATGRRTNVYAGNEYRLSREWTMAYGQEKETGGGGGSETEKAYRAKWSPGGGRSVSLTRKRARKPGGPSSTTRADYSRSVFGGDGRFLYSFSRRKSRGERTDSSRFRLTDRIGGGLSVTVSYDYSRNRAGSLDTNIIWKF